MSSDGDTVVNNGQLKIIGAGFGRTGTASFKKALEILGFGPCYHMIEVLKFGDQRAWKKFSENREDADLLHSILGGNGYVSSCDFPSAAFWEDQLHLYPDAKVILTSREPEAWYKSCTDTIFRMNIHSPFASWGTWIYMNSVSKPFSDMIDMIIEDQTFNCDWSKENVLKCYIEHIEKVKEKCPREKLLVFDAKSGWGPLCEFLSVPVPAQPYPHVNDTKSFQRILRVINLIGYSIAIVSLTASTLLGSKLLYGSFLPPQLLASVPKIKFSTFRI